MKKFLYLSLLAAVVAGPEASSAQLGVGGRVGTLGAGVEGAIGLSDRIVFRGGVGLSTLKANTTFDGIDVELSLPESWYNIGIDLYLTNTIRIGGGVLFKPDDPTLTGTFDAPVDIGGRTFTPSEIGTLTGRIESNDKAAYALIGFGRHTSSGIGISLDVGAAFLGTPSVSLAAEGGTFSDVTELNARLEQEARDFEDDMKAYLQVWPILNLVIHIGIG